MTKMFTFNGKRMITWNPFTGCNFHCTYCWARKLVETRLKRIYKDGFIPTTHPNRLIKRFKPDDFVFVCDMGDIAFAPSFVIDVILYHVSKFPNTKFLLCTKDPDTLRPFKFYQPNLYLGTTIETNRDLPFVSNAPLRHERCAKMVSISHPHKFLSIEPVMDFDLMPFAQWIADIKPEIVEIGVDNYHNRLPEPDSEKLRRLVTYLNQTCPTVILKDGIERLLK